MPTSPHADRTPASKSRDAAIARHIRAAMAAAGLPAPKPEHVAAFIAHPLVQKSIALGEEAADPTRRGTATQLGDQHLLTTLAYILGLGNAFAEQVRAAKGRPTPLVADTGKALGKLIEKHKRS